jgi:hypothetical protein
MHEDSFMLNLYQGCSPPKSTQKQCGYGSISETLLKMGGSLHPKSKKKSNTSRIKAIFLFQDISGMFTTDGALTHHGSQDAGSGSIKASSMVLKDMELSKVMGGTPGIIQININYWDVPLPMKSIGAGIYANIGGILMVNVTICSIHGSYGL